MAKLNVFISATGEKFDLPLTHAEITIGRHPDNIIVAQDNRVSRYHAVIQSEGESYRIKDPQSHNGTTVNGVEIPRGQWRPILPGDHITLAKGAVMLELVDESDHSQQISFSEMPVSTGATIMRSADQIIGEPPVSAAIRRCLDFAAE